ncbi:glycosyltransferase family 2 protein [Solirubrobacter soli]|uniref:glycosyltransferase family 2 protein n=1 Tax=Solirubrobacter soli TaxID=363832 RepID=UPI00069D1E60|nr:glycosyltransferase [Solirubrobacter soli]
MHETAQALRSAPESASAPLVSVVAATHNRRERLQRMLDALAAQTVGTDTFEVIVVDDGSSDDTPALLAAGGPEALALRTLRQPQSRGPAAARNRGWREARGTLIAFTDDDCEPQPYWLEQLLAGAGGRTDVIVQGRTLPNPAEADRNGAFARTLEVNGPSPHYPTANILYPRAVLEQLDGFNEHYGAPAGEDTDLGWRAKGLGVESVYTEDALVYHAVHERGPMNTLKDAFRATDCIKTYKDYPELRAHLDKGIFFHPSHPLLAQAVVAGVLARKQPAAAVFALPYAAHVVRRARQAGAPAYMAPFFAVRDAVEVVAVLRGSVRHRTPVL